MNFVYYYFIICLFYFSIRLVKYLSHSFLMFLKEDWAFFSVFSLHELLLKIVTDIFCEKCSEKNFWFEKYFFAIRISFGKIFLKTFNLELLPKICVSIFKTSFIIKIIIVVSIIIIFELLFLLQRYKSKHLHYLLILSIATKVILLSFAHIFYENRDNVFVRHHSIGNHMLYKNICMNYF